MLCDLGADVIKVEPPEGDITRTVNPRANGLATYFVQQNVGKRNISLDTSKPEAVELLLRLADVSDVLIENFRPGVLDRMGLGYETVAARNSGIVYASISGYGSSGPWASRRAYAPVVGAETGITKEQGDARGGQYANDPFSHADVYTALETASAILAALFNRSRTGMGDRIEVSMAETMLYVNEHAHDQLWDREVPADWIRSFAPAAYPVLSAANGESVVISGHPAERGTFERFMTAIGRKELVDDPRFADVPSRLAHFPELLEPIAAWAATIATPQLIESAMGEHGLATGTMRSVREVCETEWAKERGAVVDVSDRGGGTLRLPNSPWRFDSGDVGLRGEPRYRGEDNREVLGELLGIDDAELQRLEAEGVLSSRLPRR
jgi:crotonobetainyl-CoA:carnitine CoA-transferase CaiB-like acyl-CoA transferase